MDTKANCYDCFEPLCKWQRGTTSDTVRVHLQGFQRDQINVNVKLCKISINGEREHRSEGTSSTRYFSKEIPLKGREYKLCDVQTKFAGGVLSIILPKKVYKSVTVAGQLGLNKLVSRLNITKRTTVEVILAVSMGLAAGAYGTYMFRFHAKPFP